MDSNKISKKSKVLIVCGGDDNELAVSRISAGLVYDTLIGNGYEDVKVVEVSVGNICDILFSYAPDVVFNATHGRFGEDGSIQNIMNLLKIPYTHSGVRASYCCMNKLVTKSIFTMNGIPVARHFVTLLSDIADGSFINLVKKSGIDVQKFVVKPINSGSSVGVFVFDTNNPVSSIETAKTLLANKSFLPNDYFLVEEFLYGKEVNVVIVNTGDIHIIDVAIAEFEGDVCSYECKYSSGGVRHIYNPHFSEEVLNSLTKNASVMHDVAGCRDMSRTEFIVCDLPSGEQKVVAIETNTQPGLTDQSFVPQIIDRSSADLFTVFDSMLHRAVFEV